jgi:hypothetical protein
MSKFKNLSAEYLSLKKLRSIGFQGFVFYLKKKKKRLCDYVCAHT